LALSDRALGGILLVGSLLALAVYLYALAAGPWTWWLAVTVVMVILVGALCLILAWIGYTLLTTPAPAPPTIETPPASETPSASTSAQTEEKKEG
jgi:threonine/homoserine/homoserine lactone efflux protein